MTVLELSRWQFGPNVLPSSTAAAQLVRSGGAYQRLWHARSGG